MKAEGNLLFSPGGNTFALMISMSGERLDSLDPLVEAGLPAMGPYRIAGELTDTLEGYRVTNVRGELAGSDVTGDLFLDLTGERPRLMGRLTSEKVHLGFT